MPNSTDTTATRPPTLFAALESPSILPVSLDPSLVRLQPHGEGTLLPRDGVSLHPSRPPPIPPVRIHPYFVRLQPHKHGGSRGLQASEKQPHRKKGLQPRAFVFLSH